MPDTLGSILYEGLYALGFYEPRFPVPSIRYEFTYIWGGLTMWEHTSHVALRWDYDWLAQIHYWKRS